MVRPKFAPYFPLLDRVALMRLHTPRSHRSKEPHLLPPKTHIAKTPTTPWARYDLSGNPITPEMAHPGNEPGVPKPAAPPVVPSPTWWMRLGVAIGLLLYSGDVH